MLKKYKLSIIIALAILVVSVIPISAIPKTDVKLSDKLGHFIAYAVLSLIVHFETAKKFRLSIVSRRLLIYSSLICVIFGVLMEFLQATPFVNRHFELLDMFANSIGVGVGSAIFLISFRLMKRFYTK
jgi:VanZ family protein